MRLPAAITRAVPSPPGSRLKPQIQPQAPAANAVATANITVDYHGFPANAKTAFQAAVDIWKTLVTSSTPILVDATWSNLTATYGDSTILGSSSPSFYIENFENAPRPNTYYPVALANAISGIDQAPPDSDNPNGAEISADFNSNPSTSWYFGTDGHPGSQQEDLETVVLHELGHGLGFLGSFDGLDPNSQQDVGRGYYGLTSDGQNPTIFDRFVSDVHGVPLISSTYPNGSIALGRVLRGGTANGVRWNGAWGIRAAGMQRPTLYSPATWMEGSSFSHLDESTYPAGSANALMTPGITEGEADHSPGPIVLAMLRDMGWPKPCTSTVAAGTPSDTFHPVTPQRIYSAAGYAGHPVDVPATGLAAVPISGVDAVAVNVEVYQPSTAGYIQVVPGCAAFNSAGPSTQQFATGQTRLESAVVRLDNEGAFRIWVAHGSAILNVDIAGWFSPNTSTVKGDRYHTVNTQFLVPGGVNVKAGVPVDQAVLGRGGIPATGVDAVVLKADITKPTATGWLIVSPGGVNTATGTQSFSKNERISNLVMVRPGTGAYAGKLRLRVTSGTANVAFEVVGYYSPPSDTTGLVYHPLPAPARLLNGMRTSQATVAGLPVSSPVLLNVGIGNPSGSGWLGVGRSGGTVLRGTQEYDAGQSISGLMAADTGAGAAVRIRTSVGVATLYADEEGYFAAS